MLGEIGACNYLCGSGKRCDPYGEPNGKLFRLLLLPPNELPVTVESLGSSAEWIGLLDDCDCWTLCGILDAESVDVPADGLTGKTSSQLFIGVPLVSPWLLRRMLPSLLLLVLRPSEWSSSTLISTTGAKVIAVWLLCKPKIDFLSFSFHPPKILRNFHRLTHRRRRCWLDSKDYSVPARIAPHPGWYLHHIHHLRWDPLRNLVRWGKFPLFFFK